MISSVFAACSKDKDEDASASTETTQSTSKNKKNKKDKKNKEDDEKKDDEDEDNDDEDDVDDKNETSTKGLSDNLFDFTVSIEGKIYTFPAPYSEFAKNGWKGDDIDSLEIEPNSYNSEGLVKGKKSLWVTFANFDQDVLPYSECLVAGIKVEDSYNDNPAKVVISKGISLGSTYDEVIKAFGEPDDEYKNDDQITISYEKDVYSEYTFYFDNKRLTEIDIENIVAPKNSSKPKDSASTETPDVVKNYKAPTSLGNDLNAFNIKFDGALYNLPVPIAELEKNGWKIVEEADRIIPAKNFAYSVELQKNSKSLYVDVKNYSNKGTTLKNCFAISLKYTTYSCNVPFELPKGITEKSTLKDITAAYGQANSKETITDSTYYGYGKYDEQVVFSIKDNKIEMMQIEHNPDDLK